MRTWIAHIEARGSPEGVASNDDGCIGCCHREKSDGCFDVEALGTLTIVRTFAIADATKIRRKGDAVTFDDTGDDVLHHDVVTVTAVQGMRMAHHPCCSRRDCLICAREVGFEHESIECLQRNGFHTHRVDGTVQGVSGGDEKLPIKMLNDRLLVRIPQNEGERRSSGGILIPATAQISKRLVWAEVVALGANVRSAEVGDRVLFSPDDRYEVEVGGNDYIMLRERDIHAVAASRIEASTGLYL
jgi:chaperonin GroES